MGPLRPGECISVSPPAFREKTDDTSGEDNDEKEAVASKGRKTANSQGRRKGRITRSMASEANNDEAVTPQQSAELGEWRTARPRTRPGAPSCHPNFQGAQPMELAETARCLGGNGRCCTVLSTLLDVWVGASVSPAWSVEGRKSDLSCSAPARPQGAVVCVLILGWPQPLPLGLGPLGVFPGAVQLMPIPPQPHCSLLGSAPGAKPLFPKSSLGPTF